MAMTNEILIPDAEHAKPLFYVKGDAIFQRPVRTEKGVRMGFCVCEVCDGVEPQDVCDLLNKA